MAKTSEPLLTGCDSPMPAKTGLDRVASQVNKCTRCRLWETRTLAVPGVGPPSARIMLVGEGPGRNEDLKGTPFVGAAGKFLDELLRLIGLKREEIFITNIVKCRPPGNRDPLPDEVAACLPYLRRQTRIIKPSLICTLGNSATRTLTDPDSSISRVHGSFVAKKGFTFCALYHPAAALYNGSLRQVQEADFIKLGEYLKKNVPGEER